jgi:hypothetical protein
MATLRATDPALAAEIERRARGWLAKYGSDFPGDSETGVLGTSAADQAKFEDFANDAACPALDSGAESLGHCELCFIGATPEQVAACEMPVPHELEAELLDELGSQAETVVAFVLLR